MKKSFHTLTSQHWRSNEFAARRFHDRNRSRRAGSVVLFVALGMLIILGCGAISVDYGLMIADKNRLQRACDAAALAGVSQLKVTGDDNVDTYNARNLAVSVAAQNGVTVPANSITFLNDNKTIISRFGCLPASHATSFSAEPSASRTNRSARGPSPVSPRAMI
jgi:Flp pilus assembly protein TadG